MASNWVSKLDIVLSQTEQSHNKKVGASIQRQTIPSYSLSNLHMSNVTLDEHDRLEHVDAFISAPSDFPIPPDCVFFFHANNAHCLIFFCLVGLRQRLAST